MNLSSEQERARQRRLANLKPFKKGQSGNPKGCPGPRPKKPVFIPRSSIEDEIQAAPIAIEDIREAAKLRTNKAMRTLEAALTAPECRWSSRIAAAQAILDRGWGKPKEHVQAEVGLDLKWLLKRGRERNEQRERERLLIEGDKTAWS